MEAVNEQTGQKIEVMCWYKPISLDDGGVIRDPRSIHLINFVPRLEAETSTYNLRFNIDTSTGESEESFGRMTTAEFEIENANEPSRLSHGHNGRPTDNDDNEENHQVLKWKMSCIVADNWTRHVSCASDHLFKTHVTKSIVARRTVGGFVNFKLIEATCAFIIWTLCNLFTFHTLFSLLNLCLQTVVLPLKDIPKWDRSNADCKLIKFKVDFLSLYCIFWTFHKEWSLKERGRRKKLDLFCCCLFAGYECDHTFHFLYVIKGLGLFMVPFSETVESDITRQ